MVLRAFDLLSSPGWLTWDLNLRVISGQLDLFTFAALFKMFGIWDLPADLCGSHFPALVHKDTHTHTHILLLCQDKLQTHPPLSRVPVCLRVHACVLTVAHQTVNRPHCLMPVCDSVCLLWVCLSLCVRICVLVWGRGSLSETETKRAFLFTLELGKVPNERLWIWWGGTLEPSSVSHTKVGFLCFSQGWASITLLC